MQKRCWRPAVTGLLLVVLAARAVDAHSDFLAPIQRIEKTYQVEEPLGKIVLEYSTATGDEPASLRIQSGLFDVEVPPEGLADLPRPDWEGARVLYSMISHDFDEMEWVDRPYIFVRVPLRGPRGEQWHRTWIQFHLDHEGNLSRKLRGHGASQIDWPIGSERSAEELLEKGRTDD